MAQIKVATTFFGKSKYREAEMAKSVISLKLMYRDKITVTVVTDQRSYLDSAHGQMMTLYPAVVCDRGFAERNKLEEYIGFYFGKDNPEASWLSGCGANPIEIPVDKSHYLNFESKIYGNIWTYPKFSYMVEYIKNSLGVDPVCYKFTA
jgi:hypothetical protein